MPRVCGKMAKMIITICARLQQVLAVYSCHCNFLSHQQNQMLRLHAYEDCLGSKGDLG